MTTIYYTPIGLPAPAHAVKGYRKLRAGTVLKKGDVFWSNWDKTLKPTSYVGSNVCAIGATTCHYYRLKSK